MKHILEVLEKADEPLSLTEMIMQIMHLTPVKDHYIQQELASALIHESVGGQWYSTPTWITLKKNGKRYHPTEYANLLYAKYSRAIRRLKAYGLIADCGFRPSESKGYRHTRTFRLTSRTDLLHVNSSADNYLYSALGYKPYGVRAKPTSDTTLRSFIKKMEA
jgi:hypothetical protein